MSNRIEDKFRELRAQGRTALAPFITVGFPTVQMSEQLAETILASGGDLLELGIPFSDPLADGPTIQRTSFQALTQGVNVSTSLDMVRNLRRKGIEAPLILMGYYNPFLRYGVDKLVADAASVGVDGFIVPDLPPEEAGQLKALCESHGIHLIPLLAPTSTDERIANACKDAKGFIYCVSLTGVTGSRESLSHGLAEFIGRVRKHTDIPILVGFGVSRKEHVDAIAKLADGAIVASALLDAVDKSEEGQELETARKFIEELRGS